MKKRHLGYAMVSAPFVAVFTWISIYLGWEGFVFVFGFTAIIVLLIIGGVHLICNEPNDKI